MKQILKILLAVVIYTQLGCTGAECTNSGANKGTDADTGVQIQRDWHSQPGGSDSGQCANVSTNVTVTSSDGKVYKAEENSYVTEFSASDSAEIAALFPDLKKANNANGPIVLVVDTYHIDNYFTLNFYEGNAEGTLLDIKNIPFSK